MNEDSQRAVAAWAVIVLPFLLFGGLLYTRDQLTIEFVVFYWFPVIVSTLIGTLPTPWKPLVS